MIRWNWPKSDEFKKVAETLKSSGKVKMVGFSCHDGRLKDYLNAAAQGGFLDIIMLRYTPFFHQGRRRSTRRWTRRTRPASAWWR